MAVHNHSDRPIIVIGDVLLDRWVYCGVDRLNPENPSIPLLRVDKVVESPGGAANVCENLKALGWFFVLAGAGRPVSTKTRLVVDGRQVCRFDDDRITPLDGMGCDDAYKLATTYSQTPACVILSDYGKGMFAGDLAPRVLDWCRRYKIPSIVDPKGDWRRYHGASIITPNEAELGDMDPEWAMRTYDLQAILVTKGSRGMDWWDRGLSSGNPIHIPAIPRGVFDVTGAGDTVVAALAWGIASGQQWVTAARTANAAASVVVGKPGTAVCTIEELAMVLS